MVNNRERTSVKLLDSSNPNRRTVDLSKVTLVNSTTTHNQNHRQNQQHSVLVLADGTRCIRTTPNQTSKQLVPTRRQITTNVRQTPQLTPSDILDLPIIFADNDTTLLTDQENLVEQPIISQPQIVTQPQQHKYVLINKHGGIQGHKRTNQISGNATQSQPKYARIIINNSTTQQVTQPQVAQPQQVQFEFLDLETELKTNTVPKPPHQIANLNSDPD